jgi:hypothetical protein
MSVLNELLYNKEGSKWLQMKWEGILTSCCICFIYKDPNKVSRSSELQPEFCRKGYNHMTLFLVVLKISLKVYGVLTFN